MEKEYRANSARSAEPTVPVPQQAREGRFEHTPELEGFDDVTVEINARSVFRFDEKAISYVTPLDPTYTIVSESGLPFPSHMVQLLVQDPREFIGEEMDERIDWQVVGTITDEVVVGSGMRCTHNNAAMNRLLDVMHERQPTPEMSDIIKRARRGEAPPHEIVRIVKEYPEMLSAELHRVVVGLDSDIWNNVIAEMDDGLQRLAQNSPWSEVEIYEPGDREQTSFSIQPSGLVIVKHRVASARSADSDVEIIRAKTGIVVAHDEQGRLVRPKPSRGDVPHEILPIAVSEYARTADYAERRALRPLDMSQYEDLTEKLAGTEVYIEEEPFFEDKSRAGINKKWKEYVDSCMPEVRKLLSFD